MKRVGAVLIIIVLIIGCLASCGEKNGKKAQDGKAEIAMLVGESGIDDESFNQTTWEAIESFCDSNDKTCNYYVPKKHDVETYLKLIDKAIKNGAKIIIVPGSTFETTVFEAQKTYPDVKFLLIDGIPHDDNKNYLTEANTEAVIFAEEEAGFLAGYAAVMDGYKKLGFMGGQELPSIKRYGYGFVQGVAYGATQSKKKVEVRYIYTNTFEASKEVKKLAASWYKDGTGVIFACGGSMGKSVMKAAEKADKKTIGVDTDQSIYSETVITSAKKSIGYSVERALKEYNSDSFAGGQAFNYSARNKGVSLEFENAKFNKFTKPEYRKVFKLIKTGEIQLKKDTDVSNLADIAGEWVTVVK